MHERHAQLLNRDTMSRNFSIDQPDVVVGARLRGRPGYQLKRRIGRGVTVRRRMTTNGWMAHTGGVALISIGFAAFVLGLFTDIHIAGGQPVALMLAGGQAMILGTGLFCYQQLLIRSSANEQALLFQHDIGYEQGWREREQAGLPVVVDLEARRKCSCGSGKAQKTAVKVGDRG